MTETDYEYMRRRLAEEQGRVKGLIDAVKVEMGDGSETDSAGDLSGYDQHPADSASDTFEREKDFSILESLETELAEIEAALQRIDAGTYGIDEVTGDPIDPERLDAIPTARTNITGGAHPHDATHGSGAEPI